MPGEGNYVLLLTVIGSGKILTTITKMHSEISSAQLLGCVQLYDPTNYSTPGLPVHHQLPESTQTHVH